MVVDNDDDMLEDGRHGVKREEGRGGGSPADDNTNTNTNNTSSSSWSSKNAKGKKSVPVCVMLPLDLINPDSGRFLDETKEKLSIQLEKLRSANVSSVMIDVWWGIVENEAPGKYNWGGYKSLIELIIKSCLLYTSPSPRDA